MSAKFAGRIVPMIDTATGEIAIESVPIRIGARFSRREFLASRLAEDSSVVVRNEPYCSFRAGSYEISGLRLALDLRFRGERLEAVSLVYPAEEFGSSWSDWSEDKELKRKQIHDAWLVSATGSTARSYEWGEIRSDFDAKSGGSAIVIRYFSPD